MFDPSAWLQKNRIEKSLGTQATRPAPKPSTPEVARSVPQEAVFSLAPAFEQLLEDLALDQLDRADEFKKLNPSRRDSVAKFLCELAKRPESHGDQALAHFIRTDRTPTENQALFQLCKQMAMAQLGKAMLLKSWETKGLIRLHKSDLMDLTASVERELRPFSQLQRNQAQLVQKNFFSWSKIQEIHQDRLWSLLNQIDSMESARCWLLKTAIRVSAETLGERHRYGAELFQSLWSALLQSNVLSTRFEDALRRKSKVIAFSPSLRDGCALSESPREFEWVGFEPITFELLFCEIRHFWEKPREPCLWVKGSGLEMNFETQRALLTNSAEYNALQQIDQIQHGEVALVCEESLIFLNGKTRASQSLKKQVDAHPVLKKLKHPHATRGMYQVFQALEKLRQGGLLIWAREDLLNEDSGKPLLNAILSSAQILMIADLGKLECAHETIRQNTPRVLMVLRKESEPEARKSHHPVLINTYGSLRSPDEAHVLIHQIFKLMGSPHLVFPPEPVQIHVRVSPVPQAEWNTHWVNPADDQKVEQIETLKRESKPLIQFAQVYEFSDTPKKEELLEDLLMISKPTPALYVGYDSTTHALWVESDQSHAPIRAQGQPFYVVRPFKPEYQVPLKYFLKSAVVHDWVGYHVERKKNQWILKDRDLRGIPVPEPLAQALSQPDHEFIIDDLEKTVLEHIPIQPNSVQRAFESIVRARPETRGYWFSKISQIIEQFEQQSGAIYALFDQNDQLHWHLFLSYYVDPASLLPMDHHPGVRPNGFLPPHVPVTHVKLVNMPAPGVFFATEKGMSCTLLVTDPWLQDFIFTEALRIVESMNGATWTELCKHIFIPADPNQVRELAEHFIKSFYHQRMKRKELSHLLTICLNAGQTANDKSSPIGLLQ